jgi:glutamate formiminotransferase
VLEAVPNVSEGRDASVIDEIARAFASRATVLDVHADADHHRSVFTVAGEEEPLVDALLAGVARAHELVDLRRHDGVHPRVGAVDVVPLVALVPQAMEDARRAAKAAAERIAAEWDVPVFLYGEVGGDRVPAFFRRGGAEGLAERVASGELRPDYGPARLDARSGAVLVGARPPLVAYNLVLDTDDLAVARAVAAAVRASSGGMPGVQALGLALPRAGRVQVSMNVLDLERSPLHEVVELVTAEAAARGTGVVEGELVGLVPERVLEEAQAAGFELEGVDESTVLERRLALAR